VRLRWYPIRLASFPSGDRDRPDELGPPRIAVSLPEVFAQLRPLTQHQESNKKSVAGRVLGLLQGQLNELVSPVLAVEVAAGGDDVLELRRRDR